MDPAQSQSKMKLFGHTLDLSDMPDSYHGPPPKRTKTSHPSADVSPTPLPADNVHVATPDTSLQGQITQLNYQLSELQDQHEAVQSRIQKGDKARDEKLAEHEAILNRLTGRRDPEIASQNFENQGFQIIMLKEDVYDLTKTSTEQDQEIIKLRKENFQLKHELVSALKEQNRAMRRAAPSEKTQPQPWARQIEAPGNPTGASQTTHSSGKTKKQAEPAFRLQVLTHDKTFGFIVAGEKDLSVSAVPDDLLKMEKLALRMAPGIYKQSDVHIVFERAVCMSQKRYVPLPSKRYVAANDQLYDDWSKEVRSERSGDGAVAAAARVRSIRAYIWKGEDDKARSLFKDALARV